MDLHSPGGQNYTLHAYKDYDNDLYNNDDDDDDGGYVLQSNDLLPLAMVMNIIKGAWLQRDMI